MAVITISRHFGSGGEAVAQIVAQKSGYLLVNKEMIREKMFHYEVPESDLTLFDEKKFQGLEKTEDKDLKKKHKLYLEALHDLFYDLAIRENLVVLGRGGQVLFKDFPPATHIKIISPLNNRMDRVKRLYGLDEAAAARLITEQDMERAEYLQDVFGYDWFDLDLYDLVLNTGKIGLEEAATLIVSFSQLKESTAEVPRDEIEEEQLLGQIDNYNQVLDAKGAPPRFAHPSEEEFARMLDFYRIQWLYEPKSFPLEWDSEGNITEAFAPDFYLPEQDLYVELTTQRQKLVWKKNKKVRRLKEMYPHVNIKVIYGRDYRGLLQKYGLEKGEDKNNKN